MSKMKGLGRGLESLIPTKEVLEDVKRQEIAEVNVNSVSFNPHQPRSEFDKDSLEELALSIKEYGVLQPLIVNKIGDEFQLVAGERRLRASKIAGLKKVPVIVRSFKKQKQLEIALVENIHRTDLNPIEKSLAFKKLVDEFNLSHDEVAKKVGKSRSAVTNTIRLLELPDEIKDGIKKGEVTEGHARALLMLDNPQKQLSLYRMITKQKLSVRDVEGKVRRREKKEIDIELRNIASRLRETLGAKVEIYPKSKGGRISIEYYSNEELERIYRKIVKG